MVLQWGKCGSFVLINKWCSWVQSALHGIRLYVQSGSNGTDDSENTFGGNITVLLISSLSGLYSTKQDNPSLIACNKDNESKPVKLEHGSAVLLPPMVSSLDDLSHDAKSDYPLSITVMRSGHRKDCKDEKLDSFSSQIFKAIKRVIKM